MSREKRCRRCSETKPAASFRADSRYRDGFGSWCRDCHRSRSGSWAKENRARASAKAQERREQNRDAARAANRKHKRAHRAALAAKHAAWAKANKDKRRVSWARRRAAKVGATPIWADKKMIAAIYRAAVALQTATGQRMHVDHIIPLQHELVCGLHCEANLQILPGALNESKRNNWTPDSIEDAQRQGDMLLTGAAQ